MSLCSSHQNFDFEFFVCWKNFRFPPQSFFLRSFSCLGDVVPIRLSVRVVVFDVVIVMIHAIQLTLFICRSPLI